MRNMDALTWFLKLNKGVGGFWSTESPKKRASNSEIRRWFEKGSIIINGERAKMDDEITEIKSCVIHPKGKRRCTIF
jgi:23S rRNA-/tRNA-specific pseudouridylate synthase